MLLAGDGDDLASDDSSIIRVTMSKLSKLYEQVQAGELNYIFAASFEFKGQAPSISTIRLHYSGGKIVDQDSGISDLALYNWFAKVILDKCYNLAHVEYYQTCGVLCADELLEMLTGITNATKIFLNIQLQWDERGMTLLDKIIKSSNVKQLAVKNIGASFFKDSWMRSSNDGIFKSVEFLSIHMKRLLVKEVALRDLRARFTSLQSLELSGLRIRKYENYQGVSWASV